MEAAGQNPQAGIRESPCISAIVDSRSAPTDYEALRKRA